MKTALTFEQVGVSYGAVAALREVTVNIPEQTRTAIVGPNGAGKSTLLRAALGLEKGRSGRVSILGEDENLTKIVQKKVAYIPQASQINLNFPATVFEVVLMGRYPHITNFLKYPSRRDKEIVEMALQRMNLQDVGRRQIDQLSGGQRQRVFIARALAQEAQLYLMDEPLAGIDQLTERIIMDTLKEFQKEGKTSIVIHHDLSTLSSYFDYLVWLNKTVIAAGEIDSVLTDEQYQRTYGVPSQGFKRNRRF